VPLDNFRRLLGQTQLALDRLKGDTHALHVDLRQLRSVGDHLGKGYTRLGDICRLTEKRSELTIDVLDAIEKRIEPLEVVRDLGAASEERLASLKRLAEEITRCGASFEAQREAIDQGREEATRVFRLMEELQARISSLIEKGEWLGQAAETVGRLEHLAGETTAQLEQRLNGFDAQKQTIEQALVAARTNTEQALGQAEETAGWLEQRAADTTTQLERRVTHFGAQTHTIEQGLVAALAASDQRVEQSAARVDQLEQRAAETAVQLERCVNNFDVRRQNIEQALVAARTESDLALDRARATVGGLEQWAAETTVHIDRRVNDFDAQKQTIVQSLVAAVTVSGQRLEQAAATVGRLEQRAADATAQLDGRVSHFDAQKLTIERAAAEAVRVTAILSAIEERVAALSGSQDALGQAETTVGQLERRAAEAKARLEQVVTGKHEVERELERLGRQLQTLTESARNTVSGPRSSGVSIRWPVWQRRRPLLRWATVLGALVVLEVAGLVMLRTHDQPAQIASILPPAERESPLAAPVSLLPSKPTSLSMFVMPVGRAAATTGTIAANGVSATDRPDLLHATGRARTAGASQPGGSAREPVQYVGALTVDSEPTGSVVFVDGQQIGETPVELAGLRAGSHVVRIERDGYDRWTTAVLVVTDKQTSVSAKLQAPRGR
jgi:chromosome segregation ATPase